MLHLIPRVVEFLGYDPLADSDGDASLGERIVWSRRARGIRQKDLARQLGVDPGTLAHWEYGK
jgi:DNA-binding transcriptional regulator YiaG